MLWDLAIARSDAPFIYFDIRKNHNVYLLYFDDGVESAVLDNQTIDNLNGLKVGSTVRFEAVVQSSVFTKRQRGRNRLPQLFALSINVYGTNSSADGISSQIAKLSIYLQHPRSLYAEVEYRNPQYLIFNNEDIDMRQLIGIGSDSPQISQMKISKEVENILESLTGVNFTGEKFEVPGTLTSKLKEQVFVRRI